ncbi:MAG: type II toxin-antitoxin system VapC family toxin [Geitlerinemataceae cyanobacterium]
MDTGFVVALLNDRDRNHQAAARTYSQQGVIAMSQTVLSEAAYMLRLRTNRDRVVQWLRAFRVSRYQVTPVTQVDLDRVADILEQYRDSRIDFVDASVMAVAERLGVCRILTLDRRDFGLFRPRHCESFEILP